MTECLHIAFITVVLPVELCQCASIRSGSIRPSHMVSETGLQKIDALRSHAGHALSNGAFHDTAGWICLFENTPFRGSYHVL